jgi:hypothetical protein
MNGRVHRASCLRKAPTCPVTPDREPATWDSPVELNPTARLPKRAFPGRLWFEELRDEAAVGAQAVSC